MKKYIFMIFFISLSLLACTTTSQYNNSPNSSSIPARPSTPTFTITDMDLANTLNRNVIGTYGTSFVAADIRYIASRITYNYTGSTSSDRALNIKIIKPDGNLMTGTSSPNGYTFNETLAMQPNSTGEKVLLPGWGNESGGAYSPGIYTYEIWSNGQRLQSTRFTVQATFTITGMDFANTDTKENLIGTYGTSFEVADIKFISPRITYNNIGSTSDIIVLDIRIKNPDGSLRRNADSPIDYTFSDILSVQPNERNKRILLSGWGNESGGAYSPGTYTYEIWSDGQMLRSSRFTVHAPFTITGMDFANTDKNMNIIGSYGTSFDPAAIRYIVPRITYDNTGSTSGNKVLDIKIINPDGSLKTYTESPRDYTINYTLNVRSGRKDERVLLTGLGSESGGTYSPGTYTCEIWSDGQRLYSARFTVNAYPVFTITDMDFANTLNRNIIGTHGMSFDAPDIRYIAPRITYDYNGSTSISRILNVKIINPDGSLKRGTSSPSGYTFDYTLSVLPNKRGERVLLSGWGSNSGGSYLPGIYNCEIWYDGQQLFSTKFTVHAPFTITGIDFANTDRSMNVIGSYATSFESSSIRYIVPRITYDNTGSSSGNRILNIKIIKPDGYLMGGTSSPSDYTMNYTLNIQPNKRGERILLSGWGSDSGGAYLAGTYTCEIWSDGQRLYSARFTVAATRDILFTYDGPQGSRARVFHNNQLLGTITPGSTFNRTLPIGSQVFELQIEDTSNSANNSQRTPYTVNVINSAASLGIVARRTPSGVIRISDFSITR